MINPHDYELTDEESEALLLKSEHAIVPPLSPAARAVLDAYNDATSRVEPDLAVIAAALRAAADQLTFEDSLAGAVINPRELLDIAAELEGAQ